MQDPNAIDYQSPTLHRPGFDIWRTLMLFGIVGAVMVTTCGLGMWFISPPNSFWYGVSVENRTEGPIDVVLMHDQRSFELKGIKPGEVRHESLRLKGGGAVTYSVSPIGTCPPGTVTDYIDEDGAAYGGGRTIVVGNGSVTIK